MTSAEDGAEKPYDLLSSYLNRRIQLDKNGQVIVKNQDGNTELNSDGSPKSVVQKMHEIKQGTLKNLFISAKDSSQNNLRVNDSEQKFAGDGNQRQIGKPTYTREQARKGKADISAICRRPVCQTHDNLPSITVSRQLCPYSACDTHIPLAILFCLSRPRSLLPTATNPSPHIFSNPCDSLRYFFGIRKL